MNTINIVIGIVAVLLAFLFAKKNLKASVIALVLVTALVAIFAREALAKTAPMFQIGAVLLWLIAAIITLKITRANSRYAIVAMLVIALAIMGIAYFAPKASAETQAEAPQEVVLTETGQKTWPMKAGDYTNNRWFPDGAAKIQSATTKEEALAATQDWLEKVKTDPNLLVGAAKFFLNRDVDKASLVDAEGYATDKAVQLVAEIQLAIGTAKSVTPAEAPANGINSGVDNGSVVQASSAGIDGDRKAVQVVLQNGETIWIMARCGNPVTASDVGLPKGGTDNPPAKGGPPTPPTPPTLEQKDPSQDPAPQGNAPEGGGQNIDPGAGEYVAPENMVQPTAEPYVAPPPPVSVEPTIPEGSTPDVTPYPEPEPEAPTPEAPAEGEVKVPGM